VLFVVLMVYCYHVFLAAAMITIIFIIAEALNTFWAVR